MIIFNKHILHLVTTVLSFFFFFLNNLEVILRFKIVVAQKLRSHNSNNKLVKKMIEKMMKIITHFDLFYQFHAFVGVILKNKVATTLTWLSCSFASLPLGVSLKTVVCLSLSEVSSSRLVVSLNFDHKITFIAYMCE